MNKYCSTLAKVVFICILLFPFNMGAAGVSAQTADHTELGDDLHPPVPALGTPVPLRHAFESYPAQCDAQHCAGSVPVALVNASSLTLVNRHTRGSNSQLTIPQNIMLADVDADGISDLVQNAGSNLFVRKMDYEQTKILHIDVRLRIKRVLTGDFHGDHYDQTCIIIEDNSLACYGTSPGRRELWWWFTQGTIADDNEDTIVGDFDGDGRDDILVYPRAGGPFRMYSIKGDFFSIGEKCTYTPGKVK